MTTPLVLNKPSLLKHAERADMNLSRLSRDTPISSNCVYATGSIDSSSLEDDIWNLDIDDILDNDNSPVGKFGMRSNSFSSSIVPRRGSFKTRRSLPNRAVSFGRVEIRKFERVLGDNPACGKGPSMALGWRYNEEKPVELDNFESKKRSVLSATRRRNSKELIMSPEKRERIARRFGFSEKEIISNVQKVEKASKQRRKTQALEDAMEMVSFIERTRRLHGFK